MSDPFATPGSIGGIEWKNLTGSLLLVTVHEIVPHVQTVNTRPGEQTPATRCDVAVLDGDESGSEYADTLIFPKVLQGQLRSRVGQKVLARLTQGTAKPGQSAPWMLSAEITDDDRKKGMDFLTNGFAAPGGSANTGNGADELPPF
jgi:hypothetical protein